jgi:hypothetical protein
MEEHNEDTTNPLDEGEPGAEVADDNSEVTTDDNRSA